jgi:ABC-type nitrate/sulfonate/bicarbonate transport system substrate-binding protein
VRFGRFIPLILAVVLGASTIYFSIVALPVSSGATNVTLHVVYPDALDESDVSDQFAFQILAAEGIHVVPTYYDSASLAYESLVAGQQDIAYDESGGSFGIGGTQQQTTCIGGYMLGGTFVAIVGDGITEPSQLLGKVADDSGPGSITRFLNEYWFKQAGIPFNLNAPTNGSVYLRTGKENYDLVHDIETGVVQEIVVDNFIIADFESPSVNNSADGGPYHVLFYSPNDNLDTCYVARDNWLENPANQKIAVDFLAALYQAQRIFISNPAAFVTFAEKFLPLSPVNEIQYSSVFYPEHFTYWPYGEYNLQGNQSLAVKFQDTVNFFMQAGVLSAKVNNDSVKPYGIINKYFELQALQSLGPFVYPKESWVNANFSSDLQAWVPSWMDM